MTQLTPKRMSDVFSVKAISAKQFCDALEKQMPVTLFYTPLPLQL